MANQRARTETVTEMSDSRGGGRLAISVAMATYNGARFIREQLESIARQELLPIEIQIGDDGSTDGTEEIVRDFARTAPFDIVFTRNDEQLGYGENFLRTASCCRGDWIAFSDQDDVWLPNKLSRTAQVVAEGPPDIMLVAHDALLADEEARPLGRKLYGYSAGVFPSLTLPGAWLCAGFLQMFRADLVRDFALWPRSETPHPPEQDLPGMVRYPHDGWIPVLANVTGTIVRLDEPLALYRRHSSTVTILRSASAREEVRIALDNHARRYGELARWYEETASVFLQQRENVPVELHGRLDRAIAKFRQEATDLTARRNLYRLKGIGARSKFLAHLLSSGAYRRRWTMRPASAIKDFSRLVWATDRTREAGGAERSSPGASP